MEELLSRIDVSKTILDHARRLMYTPVKWQFSPAMWRAVGFEAMPPYIPAEPTRDSTQSLWGIPVEVSVEYPGIDLVITKSPR